MGTLQKDFQLTVDIENKIRTPSFEVNTLDLKTVRLQITIIQGMSLVDLTGITVRMSIQKPDKNVLFQECEVINARAGLVEIMLDNQAYLLPGKYIAELMCFQGAEVVAVTGSFSYTSTKGILTDEAVESKSEFTAITGMVKYAQETLDDLRENGTAIDARAREEASISLNTLSTMRDPLAYLNSIEVLCSFPARETGTMTWVQGFSINEDREEIYVSNQENDGTFLRIDVRGLDGSFKKSKTLPIQSGSYTENLPFFYNNAKQLCFVVRPEKSAAYAIYNFDTGELSESIMIKGGAKGERDGNYFITCDPTGEPYTMKYFYIYDWNSIANKSPVLLNEVRLENQGYLIEKVQGIVLNNGYVFIPQGKSHGEPALTVYNTAGKLVNSFLYTKRSLAEAINNYIPGSISDHDNYNFENESGSKYQGKLALAQVVNGTVYICIHNSPLGIPLETKVPVYQNDTGWQNVTLLNGTIAYAPDAVPRIRRIGNQVMLNGAVKGLASHASVEVLEVPAALLPDRSFQFPGVTSNGYQCNWQMSANGKLRLLNTRNTNTSAESWYPFHTIWFI